MWTAIACILGFGGLLWAVIALSKNYGRAAAQTEALKAEAARNAKEQERANKIIDRVDRMSTDSVRQRLRDISNDK